MSSAVSVLPASAVTQNNAKPTRPSANFHPTIWRDHFLVYASDSKEGDDNNKEQVQILKEQVRKMLVSNIDHNNLSPKLNFIDSLQRLGVLHHFEHEIDEALQQIHYMYTHNDIIFHEDELHSLALLFRLLRQQGYRISPDLFYKFKDDKGNFSEKLANDVQGLLSLYEAAQLRVRGEDILHEALDFSYNHLKSLSAQLTSPSLAAQVNHSLKQSLHKNLPRLEARHYMSFYQQDPSHNEILLNFTKLDFNMLQKQHQQEVGSITKWWKDLNVSTRLPFARDRIVEGYFWILGVYFEPQYSLARKIMTKVTAITSVIDDIYDVHGTIEELELFTDAIERWSICCLDDLPEYMKICYKAILDVYEEIEHEMRKEGRMCIVYYAKAEVKRLIQAYIREARWFINNYTPTVEEYMQVATISCGYSFLTTISFIGMGDAATEEIFKWATSDPKIVKAASIICRLMNDIVSNEFEQKRGHVASSLECYMKQYGVSKEDAIEEFRKVVENAWKDLNEECLKPTEVGRQFLMRVVNLARVMDVFYKEEDAYTHSGGIMKNCITALLVDAVPL